MRSREMHQFVGAIITSFVFYLGFLYLLAFQINIREVTEKRFLNASA